MKLDDNDYRLSSRQQSHPVANPEIDDFEPDGTGYGLAAIFEGNRQKMAIVSYYGHLFMQV